MLMMNQIFVLHICSYLFTVTTHIITKSDSKNKLRSVLVMSTKVMVMKFDTFAIQKKKPLTISDFIPSFYISMKESDTKELKPALKTIIRKIKKYKFCNMGSILDNSMIMAAAIPKMLRFSITVILSRLNLFFKNVPRLLNMADERFAANPSIAICFPDKF